MLVNYVVDEHWLIRRFPAEFPMTNGGRHWD
jgi:hypothetical protein